MDIKYISLSDIIGVSKPEQIAEAYNTVTSVFAEVNFGIHLHIKGDDWYDKIDAAWKKEILLLFLLSI